ncbi:DUF624 domain-containing protein [Kineosporia babensis]|uniref:DUF624 domain-containing protein n=1 Tax=Kineosporia babensis TaxID=499548 RepID=A0A9X1NDU8_9ACTN|nr:DUF624 domain-containing protein [Kineosporia babensis]MCD5311989.1 DUF624 domain-containing protein [Kineosporia babensis]
MSAVLPASPARHETWAYVIGTVWVFLGTSFLFGLATLPFLTVVISTNPVHSWPLLALLAPLGAPATVAASAVFRSFTDDGNTTVLATFGRGWRRALRPALRTGAMASAAWVVLAVDVYALSGTLLGAVTLPLLAVLALLVLVVTLHVLVALAERPDLRVRHLARASVYLALRRWYLTAFSLVVLALLATLVAARPALGLGLALAPLLYVVWAGCRFTLRPILEQPE